MQEINLNDIENIRIGHAQDIEGGTGCTVIINEPVSYTHLDVYKRQKYG